MLFSVNENIVLEDAQSLDLRWYLAMESNVDKSIYVVSTLYSNTSMKSIQFTRVNFVIQTTFSYLSVKFQLTVRQNLIMTLLNYTFPIEANLQILPWFVKTGNFNFKMQSNVFLFFTS